MREVSSDRLDQRVLMLAPTARDAAASLDLFASVSIACVACKDLGDLCGEIGNGAGAVIVAQEALLNDREGCVAQILKDQPPWSDLPLIVLTPSLADSNRTIRALESVGHMTLVRRPVSVRELISTTRAALRDRARQYARRDDLTERERQADALRESEEKFRTLAESIPQLAWMAKPDGHIFWYNRRWYAYTGTTEGDMQGWGWQSVHDPELLPRVLERWGRSLKTGLPFEMVFPLRGADGRFRTFLTRVQPLRDADGRTQLWFGTNTDIEDQKRAERDVRESEERLAFSLAAGGLGSWDLDLRTGLMHGSPLCKAIFGLPPDAAFDESILFRLVHPDDRDHALRARAKALDDHTDLHVEHRTVWPDGSVHWVMARGRAVYDAKGVPLRIGGVTLDITARKEDEETARLRTAQFRSLADISTRLNAASDIDSVLGVMTDEVRTLIGTHQSVASLVRGDRPKEPLSRVSLSAKYEAEMGRQAGLSGLGLYARIDTADRSLRMTQGELESHPAWISYGPRLERTPPFRGWLAAPLVGRDGRGIGLLELSDKHEGDFTETDEAILVQLAQMASVAIENARLYEELRQNDKRKDEFLAMLAHELRNPLAAVNNAVNIIKMSDEAENREWASDVVERQVKQLVRLIDDLLDVSRITSGKIRLRKEFVDAGPIIKQAVEAAGPLIEERKHRLVVSYEPGMLPLEADPARLEQVLVNLLTNAAKYTESGGLISLSAAREGERIVIKVRDNGIGIAPELLPHLFVLFSQGERSIARSEGGLGIGLTIVMKLAEMHGGSVEASSEGPGKGSEFTIRLPSASPPRGDGAGTVRATITARKPSRILVVDDNVDTARGIVRLLKLLGNELAVAYDGNTALDVARDFLPEYVLLDIGLPGMDGYQVASRLRQHECCKDAVIIAISGYGQDDDRRRSRAAGFDHHLVKPVDFDSLVSLIGDAS